MNTLKKLPFATAGVVFIVVGAITCIIDKANAFSIAFDPTASRSYPDNYSYVYDLIGNGDSVEQGDTLSLSGLSGVGGQGTRGIFSTLFNVAGFTSTSAQFQALVPFVANEGNLGPAFTIFSNVATTGTVNFSDPRDGIPVNSGTVLGPVSSTPVPEPSGTLGLLAFGALIGGSVLERKREQQKSANVDKSVTQ